MSTFVEYLHTNRKHDEFIKIRRTNLSSEELEEIRDFIDAELQKKKI